MSTTKGRPRAVTQADVAKLAGVSTAVVSYALSGGPKPIAADTKQRVLDAAKMLDYRPNAAARALSRGRSDLVALVVPSVEQPYFAHLAAEVEQAARTAGLSLLVANALAPQVAPIARKLIGQQLRGIVMASGLTAEAAREFLDSGIPTVLINQSATFGPFLTLGPDFRSGASDAVRHLISTHGHANIAYVGGDLDTDERVVGWRNTMIAAGLTPAVAIEADYSLAGGRDAMRTLLRDHPEVTAAFFASDQFAAGAIAGLAEAGKQAPDHLAIVAFDGSPESEFVVPALTTVNVPIAQMAQDAVSQLLDNPVPGGRHYMGELVVRRSCGCN